MYMNVWIRCFSYSNTNCWRLSDLLDHRSFINGFGSCRRTHSPPGRSRCRVLPDFPPRPGSFRSDPAAQTWWTVLWYRHTDCGRTADWSWTRCLPFSFAQTHTRVLTQTGSERGLLPVREVFFLFCFVLFFFSEKRRLWLAYSDVHPQTLTNHQD